MIAEVPLSAQQEVFLSWMRETPELRHPAPVCMAIRITDGLDAGLLRRSLAEVARRHEALRTVFPQRAGRHRAMVLDTCPAEVREIRARGAGPAESLADARALACRERDRPFDIERGPLVRAAAISLGDAGHLLLLAVHHLVFDAWSAGVLLRDLGIAYSALRTGRAAGPPGPAPMQCSELTRWSRSHWPAHRLQWQRLLDGAPAALGFFPGRKPAARVLPASVSFRIEEELAARIRKTARENSATPFMVLLAAWGSVLSSWSGATDIVIMSPVSGRAHPGSETAIGCLFSSLLIRLDLSDYPGFPDVLRRVRSAAVRASQIQDYPYAEFRPLFPHAPVVGYYSWTVPLHFPGLDSDSLELPPKLVDDLEVPGSNLGVPHLLLFDQSEGPVQALLAFNEAAFGQATVEQLEQDFLHFLQRVC
jgi:hypothetical protein